MNNKLLPIAILSSLIGLAIAQDKPQSLKENAPSALTLTSLDDAAAVPNGQDDIPFAALNTFVDVFNTIKQRYVDRVDNQMLIENAIRGMLVRLDPHSQYLNEEEYQAFENEIDGQYAGIGVVLDIRSGSAVVVSTVEDSPAMKAGIKSGDMIVQIDGKTIADLNLQEINRLLDGQTGSNVVLMIQRGEAVQSVSLIREVIKVNSVSSSMLTPQIAYLRISQFQDDTAASLRKEVESLKVKFKIGGAILDLRNNAGGVLQSAVEVADLLLDKGDIVSVRGRDNTLRETFNAQAGDILQDVPLVVMVDKATASAAEIVAGALQDNQRALVVGQQTFGKGSVQTLAPLFHGGAIKLTTARYYTPSGKSIQASGITPQIWLSSLRVDKSENSRVLSEENLRNHLPNPQGAITGAGTEPKTESLAEQDFALYEALNIINAMKIVNTQSQQKQ